MHLNGFERVKLSGVNVSNEFHIASRPTSEKSDFFVTGIGIIGHAFLFSVRDMLCQVFDVLDTSLIDLPYRFDQVISSSFFHANRNSFHFPVRTHHYDGDFFQGVNALNQLQQFESVLKLKDYDLRHHQIQQHNIKIGVCFEQFITC